MNWPTIELFILIQTILKCLVMQYLKEFNMLQVNIERVSVNGRMIAASQFGKTKEDSDALEFSQKEKEMIDILNGIWKSILSMDVSNTTDFFASGAGSMDVVR